MVIVLRGPDRDARRRTQAFSTAGRAALLHVRAPRWPVGIQPSGELAFQLRGRDALARRRGEGRMTFAVLHNAHAGGLMSYGTVINAQTANDAPLTASPQLPARAHDVIEWGEPLLRCMRPLMAESRHPKMSAICTLSGIKGHLILRSSFSVFGPRRR